MIRITNNVASRRLPKEKSSPMGADDGCAERGLDMSPKELAELMTILGVGVGRFARIIGVQDRAVFKWKAKETAIPRYVAQFRRVILFLSPALRKKLIEILLADEEPAKPKRRK